MHGTKMRIIPRRSFTEQHGSMISSFAAIFATQALPVTFGDRYTIGVRPISAVTSACKRPQQQPPNYFPGLPTGRMITQWRSHLAPKAATAKRSGPRPDAE